MNNKSILLYLQLLQLFQGARNCIMREPTAKGAKYLVFVSSRFLKRRELSFAQLQLCQKNIIVNVIIQKLKNKHTFLKKYTN